MRDSCDAVPVKPARRKKPIFTASASATIAAGLVLSSAGVASAAGSSGQIAVQQTNLVADRPGWAPLVDPSLVNPWGMSFGTGAAPTPVWVSDNGTDVSTLYRNGTTTPSLTKVALTVSIPWGAPTGQVFNPSSTEFMVHDGDAAGPARFIFASESGRITGWNPAVPATATPPSTRAVSAAQVDGAVFKGLALASADGADYLYAADFSHGTIDVFDSSFAMQHWDGAFVDKHIPRGYAPFNVAALGGMLYVTYAEQDADKTDDVAGHGHGFVDVYDTKGHLHKRLVERRDLNSPWGLAIAPASWGKLAGSLLVGNFGDGRIHAYNAENGRPMGTLRDANHEPVVIDGLWALLPGNGVAADPGSILFSAGPDHESHGLVGVLRAMPKSDDGSAGARG